MSDEERNIEFIDQEDEKKETRAINFKGIFNGSLLAIESIVKQLPYILFITLLGITYIANRYHAERLVRKSTELQDQVKNLRAEQITTASELMKISKPSVVTKLVEKYNLGLVEPVEPHIKIVKKAD